MLYLKRKVDNYLLNWKTDPNKKPLIIKGSRQVGKTESITRFGYQNYKSVVYINFVEEPNYKMITTDGYKAQDIIKNISRIDPSKQFIENDTLIVFDELQDFPEIATSLKFFKIDGRFDVICSGSLLGVNYQRIESNSVGYKTDYEMFSLDFEEFLWAKGYDESTVHEMLEHMIQLKPFNEIEMSIYSSLFLDFCILGGMPAVVREYIEKGTFEGSVDIQKQLVADSYLARRLYEHVPKAHLLVQLAQQEHLNLCVGLLLRAVKTRREHLRIVEYECVTLVEIVEHIAEIEILGVAVLILQRLTLVVRLVHVYLP